MALRTTVLARCLLAAMFVVPLSIAACEKVPLLAPTGSTITLTAQATALPLNGTTDIIGQVLEAAGTPPHSGTVVTFTTTLGSIEPAEARTDVSGRITVRFQAGSGNGTATITAISGGATTGANGAVKIAIGTAAVGRVTMNASPATVPNTGGTTTVTANVFDINGNPLASAPVSFNTTSGTLSSVLVITGADGLASTALTTNQEAVVTASVGATAPSTGTPPSGGGSTTTPTGQASASVTVKITATPTVLITPPSTPPNVGLPANFTFAVTIPPGGSAVRDLRVSWGDGDSISLGAVSGTQTASHVYRDDGSYTVTATVTDVNNVSNSTSTVVTVTPIAPPTIIITPSVPSTGGAAVTRVTFTIQVTPPSGVVITRAAIEFGDGLSQTLGGLTGTTTISHDYDLAHRGPNTVIVNVTDSIGRVTTAQVTISVP